MDIVKELRDYDTGLGYVTVIDSLTEQAANEIERLRSMLVTGEAVTGTMAAVEFVEAGDKEDREPGTYITIRVDDDRQAWKAGRVVVDYINS